MTAHCPHGRHRRNLKRDWHYRDCPSGAARARYLELRADGLTTNAAWYIAMAEHASRAFQADFWYGLFFEHHADELELAASGRTTP